MATELARTRGGTESVAAMEKQFVEILGANKRLGTKGVYEGYCNYHRSIIDIAKEGEIGTDTIQ